MFGLFLFVLSVIFWGKWYFQLCGAFSPKAARSLRLAIGLAPLACLLLFLVIFFTLPERCAPADFDRVLIRTAFFVATARLSLAALDAFGVQATREIIERNNSGASTTVISALIGAVALSSGVCLGTGDGTESILLPVALSLACWLAAGTLIACVTPLVESLTVGRDRTAAFRFGLLWFATTALIAHAVATGWVSYRATACDFIGVTAEIGVLILAAYYFERRPNRASHHLIAPMVYGVITVVLVQIPSASTWNR